MTVEYIYIARHGYRMNWVTDDWTSPTGLPRDPALAPFGIAQAEELAEFFKSLPEDERPTAVFSSPYYRCLQTAQPTAKALQLPLYVEHGLSEWYSPVAPGSGLHPRPAPAAELREHFPEVDPAGWPSLYYPTRRGEDIASVHARADAVLRALVPAVAARFGGAHRRILLVSHAATVIALARALVGDAALPLRVATCSLTDVRRADGAAEGGWEAVKLADAAHLKDGLQRPWGFEDCVFVDGKVTTHSGEAGSETEEDVPVGLQVDLLPAQLKEQLLGN